MSLLRLLYIFLAIVVFSWAKTYAALIYDKDGTQYYLAATVDQLFITGGLYDDKNTNLLDKTTMENNSLSLSIWAETQLTSSPSYLVYGGLFFKGNLYSLSSTIEDGAETYMYIWHEKAGRIILGRQNTSISEFFNVAGGEYVGSETGTQGYTELIGFGANTMSLRYQLPLSIKEHHFQLDFSTAWNMQNPYGSFYGDNNNDYYGTEHYSAALSYRGFNDVLHMSIATGKTDVRPSLLLPYAIYTMNSNKEVSTYEYGELYLAPSASLITLSVYRPTWSVHGNYTKGTNINGVGTFSDIIQASAKYHYTYADTHRLSFYAGYNQHKAKHNDDFFSPGTPVHTHTVSKYVFAGITYSLGDGAFKTYLETQKDIRTTSELETLDDIYSYVDQDGITHEISASGSMVHEPYAIVNGSPKAESILLYWGISYTF